MGKGDRKTKRGKIWRGSKGKTRPTTSNLRKARAENAEKKKAG